MATFGLAPGEGTVIGSQVKLSGVLSDHQDITVLGKIDGEVHSEQMVSVGQQATIKGPITAKRVIVAGQVRGNIHAGERLEIQGHGNVTGNIETRDLVIHSGATFNGRSAIIGGEAESKAAEPAPEPVEAPAKTEERRRFFPPIRLAKRAEEADKPAPEKPPYEIE